MPELDSPVLTLGALFVAGQNQRGRRFTGGESGKGLLAGGFAAGSAEFAVSELRDLIGVDESALSDELAQALLGAGVSRWGGMIPQNRAMARGIHYNVATQAFQDAGLTLGDLAGDVTNGGTQAIRNRTTRSNGSQGVVNNRSRRGNEVVY